MYSDYFLDITNRVRRNATFFRPGLSPVFEESLWLLLSNKGANRAVEYLRPMDSKTLSVHSVGR